MLSIVVILRSRNLRLAAGLWVLLIADPLFAVDSLGVGWRGSIARWTQAVAESKLVGLDQDSIWTWDVLPNSNLGPGTPERAGFALTPNPQGVATFIQGASVLYDGDPTTAFKASQHPVEHIELRRRVTATS